MPRTCRKFGNVIVAARRVQKCPIVTMPCPRMGGEGRMRTDHPCGALAILFSVTDLRQSDCMTRAAHVSPPAAAVA